MLSSQGVVLAVYTMAANVLGRLKGIPNQRPSSSGYQGVGFYFPKVDLETNPGRVLPSG